MFTKKQWVRALLAVTLMSVGSGAAAQSLPSTTSAPQRYGVFEEPLIAASSPSPAETAALQHAVDQYKQAEDAGNTIALTDFLVAYPHTVWRASLWLNMGLVDRAHGRYSDALQAFEQAQQAAQTSDSPIGMRALNEQLALETRLGHPREVAALLERVQGLGDTAEDAAVVSMAKEGLWDMQHHPRSAFQCGWIALTALWRAEGLPIGPAPTVKMDPEHPGYSLQQLVEIATQQQQPVRAIHQTQDAVIPVPSVVHWKSGHFATIVAKVDARYQVTDPAMEGEIWMSAADVRAESSGYFLVPATDTPLASSDRMVGASEAQMVRGAGNTMSDDPHGYPDCGCTPGSKSSGGVGGDGGGTGGASPGAGDTPSPGMPTYSVSPMLISLSMQDTPLSYKPPVGPAMDFTLSYNQLDVDQPTTFTYGNVGPKWTHNWLGYVQDDPTTAGSQVLVYLPSGPGRLYHGFNAANGTFAPEAETGAQLVEVSSSPVVYERRFRDGSKDVFAASDSSTYYPRHIFLTERIDARGNAVQLAYDTSWRLSTVTDAVGQVLTFHYSNATKPLLLTSVSDAFGRSASLSYDASWRLSGTTDAIGLSSTFAYSGSTSSITGLTTPYGTTSFTTGQSGRQRWINITDANGNISRWEFNQGVSGIPYSESLVPTGLTTDNAFINSRDSFHWDAQAWATYPGDYTQAVTYHWDHVTQGGSLSSVTSDSLESIKYPLENRIWYNHPGDRSGGSGTLNVPTKIARVLDDSSTQLTSNTYNAQGNLTNSVDPDGLTTAYTYASNNIDVTQIDRTATGGYHTTESFTYDTQHNVLTHTDETGGVTQHTYNAAGQLLTTTDPLSHVTTYTYDTQGYLLSMTDANSHTTSYTYDAVGRLASSTDPLSQTTSYTYDALNRLVHTVYPDSTDEVTTWTNLDKTAFKDRNGNTTTYTYDALRQPLVETDPLSHTTTNTYYPNELLATRTDANGHTTTWNRDVEGRVTSIVDPLGATTSIAYDSADRRSSVTNALSQATTFAYDGQDRLVQTTDVNGVITDRTYNPRGWLAENAVRGTNNAVTTDDAITSYSYDAIGKIAQITQPDGAIQAFTYDAAHRLTDVSDNFNNTIHYTMDNVGNRVEDDTKDPSAVLTRSVLRVYNTLDQLQTTANADATPNADFTYDVNRNLDHLTDGLGHLTDYDYDPLGRLTHVVQDPSGVDANTNTIYDALGRVTQVTDPQGLSTSYQYDNVGNLTQLTSPDTGVTSYTYDAGDNRATKTDARGVTATYTYDALHRVTAITYPPIGIHFTTPNPDNTTFTYDGTVSGCFGIGRLTQASIGTLTSMAGGGVADTLCYDRFGHLAERDRRLTTSMTATNYYQYDMAGHVTSIETPFGTQIYYTRDAAGRITEVDVAYQTTVGLHAHTTTVYATLIDNVTYYPFGPVATISFDNGRVLTRSYDQDYVISGVTDPSTDGLDLSFSRDVIGNLTQIQSGSSGDNFVYDGLNRLTGMNDLSSTLVAAYTYDGTGNRLSKQTAAGTDLYTYPLTSHQLIDVAGTARSYDAAGNTTQIGTQFFGYDSAGRMCGLNASCSGFGITTYAYDWQGQRVYSSGSGLLTKNYTMYDESGHPLSEFKDLTHRQLREMIWMDDLPVGVLTHTVPGSFLPTVDLDYIEPDHLGTPRAVIDPVRDVAIWSWPLVDDAFGESQPNQDPDFDGIDFDLPLRFPGQEYDAESGLNYNYFRDYDPGTGRYIESDPIGLEGGTSTYEYANSNSISNIDPNGLQYSSADACVEHPEAEACEELLQRQLPPRKIPRYPVVPPPPSDECPRDQCKEKIAEIYDAMREARERIEELLIDKWKLYELARLAPNPLLPPNVGYWWGHIEQARGAQNRLLNAIKDATRAGCPIPPGAWKLALRALPNMPRGHY